jgi:hypothetical protein
VVAATPGAALGQVFVASTPRPEFSIAPLFLLSIVQPDLGPVTVQLSWSLTAPAGQNVADIKQDLYLLWPAEIAEATAAGPTNPTLAHYVEERGFSVIGSGQLMLRRRDRMQIGTPERGRPIETTASFVTFTRRGPTGVAGVGSYVKIPWTPVLADPLSVLTLSMPLRGLIGPKPATAFEEFFWGRKWFLTVGFGDVGSLVLPLYPLYFEHRDRVVRLGPDFSLAIVSFAEAERLRIEEITPPAATRRPSRIRAGSETISLVLNASEGTTPQLLKVQFSYFTGPIAWRPILISALFLLLANIGGAIFVGRDVVGIIRRRRTARNAAGPLPRELLDQIVPGVTTYEDLVTLCGPPDEEHEHFAPSVRRTLIYRGTGRIPAPATRRRWGRAAGHGQVEHHEVAIDVDGNRVQAVQSRVRRVRATS